MSHHINPLRKRPFYDRFSLGLSLGLCTGLSAFIMFPVHANADNKTRTDTAYLTLGVGYYDILDDEEAASFRGEYRAGYDLYYGVKPFAAVDVTTDGSYFLGAGLYRDFFMSENLYLTPSFSVNYYENGGSDLDLGHHIEFRSQLELGYEFNNKHRTSVGFSHYSNASFSDRNPGTETLTINYHIPVSF